MIDVRGLTEWLEIREWEEYERRVYTAPATR
jgi:hypothetical protein